MRYSKMLGLLVVALAALMAFAGSAAATTVTSPEGTVYTGEIKAESEGHAILHANNGVTIECNSTVSGKVEQHGAGVTVKGNVAAFAFPSCTGGDVVEVKSKGFLELHWTRANNGTLTSSGAEVRAVDGATGIECIFTTTATDIGELTSGSPGTLDINSSKIPRTGGSLLCGATGTWTGSYKVTGPGSLLVDG